MSDISNECHRMKCENSKLEKIYSHPLWLILLGLKMIFKICLVMVAHACNPSYLASGHWEGHGSRPACANNL
jgi:hypothetical protein